VNELTQKARVQVEAVIPGNPRAVFDAWVNPSKLGQWFCGTKASQVEAYICAREGGCYFIVMKGEKDWPHAGNYLEVSPGRRLRFTWYTPSTNNQRSDVDVAFTAVGDGTRVTIVHEALPEAMAPAHHEGWSELLRQLREVSE
jgi:uncharacterized protein YndB with AHSA1/START domain